MACEQAEQATERRINLDNSPIIVKSSAEYKRGFKAALKMVVKWSGNRTIGDLNSMIKTSLLVLEELD